MNTVMKNMEFKGFRVKPDDRGMSFITSDDDTVFNGSTDRFKFMVVAIDISEANKLAEHALGDIEFEWE